MKSEAGYRSLRLSAELTDLMRTRCEAVAGPDNPDGWLFPGRMRAKGRKPIDPGWWRKEVFRPAVEAAGLPADTVPHSLRHSAAVAMLRGNPEADKPGFTLRRVQAVLGHSTQRSTEWYGRMVPSDFGGSCDVIE